MNGYKVMADSHKKVLERDRANMEAGAIESMEAKIRVFEVLSTFSEADKFTAFDSSMFNSIFKGYVAKIMDELTEDEDEEVREAAERIRSRVTGKAAAILDRMGAKEAEKYYLD